MTAAAFRATYSDWRIVKGRKVVQVVFELPLESADEAYQVLGGMPIAAHEAWCAIARLDERKVIETDARSTGSTTETPPRQSIPRPAGADKERRSFNELSPAQQAGILANEAAFGVFLREKFGTAWMTCFDGDSLQTAASTIRYLCDVDSRRELTRENAKWASLVLAYRLWQQEPSVVPA